MQQQQSDMMENWRRNFNIAYFLFLIHQRGIVVPLRKFWGVQALGTPCFFSFLLMCFWAAFSRDPLMWVWVGFWLLCLLGRRIQTVRAGKIHSQYDGLPLWGKEKAAKLFIEPLLAGCLGGILYSIYDQYGLHAHGLPCFFLMGCVSLSFVERVNQEVWKRRVQAITDARWEQEAMAQGLQDRLET